MRFATSGSVRRLDVTLLAAVVEALKNEWAALRFGADGAAINPLTGEPYRDLVLTDGRHRVPGARYVTVTRTPVLEPDPAELQILNAETAGQRDVDWTIYLERLRAISTIPTGTTESTTTLTLTADDAQRLSFSVSDPAGTWSADVAVIHGRLPRLEATGRHDATATLTAEGVPKFLARLVGGVVEGTGHADLAALDRRGRRTLAEASGQFNRFRGAGSVDIRTSARAWDVTVKARVRAKGLGRPLLRFFGGRLRRSFTESATEFWTRAPAAVLAFERELNEARRLAETEGGIERMVHLMLWQEGYADRLGAGCT